MPLAESAETIFGCAPSSANDLGWAGVYSAGFSGRLSIVVDRRTPVLMRRETARFGDHERVAQWFYGTPIPLWCLASPRQVRHHMRAELIQTDVPGVD
jgi:hypothetical protein